jgi:hypothetical protein
MCPCCFEVNVADDNDEAPDTDGQNLRIAHRPPDVISLVAKTIMQPEEKVAYRRLDLEADN